MEFWGDLVLTEFVSDYCVPFVGEELGFKLFVVTVEEQLDFYQILFVDHILRILVVPRKGLVLVGRARQNIVHLLNLGGKY